MKALRIHDREVMEDPIVQELFVRAFKDHEENIGAQEAWQWCLDNIEMPNTAVVVARNDSAELVGLAIGQWDPSVWSHDPWLSYIYSTGEKGVVGALLAEVRVWGLGLGQKRVRWQNMAGVSDKASMRLFRKHLESQVEGSVLVGDWKEA